MFKKTLDDFIRDYCKANHFSGTVRVTHKDKIIYENFAGYEDFENKTPLNKDSVFTFYSMSKPFCVIGLLNLKDKGLVDIDKHPGVYIPEAKGFDSRVTIRQMLHHNSGMPDFHQTKAFAEKHPGCKDCEIRTSLEWLSEYPQYFEPGKGWMYANINILPAALIIENISGRSYAEYMREKVFAPLGMKTAIVDNRTLKVRNRAKGYDFKDGKLTETEKLYDWILGCGDIIGTVDDAYKLNLAIKHKLILKPETWEDVLTPSPLGSMGMGCSISTWHGKKRITHNGGHRGFRTLHIYLPEDDFDIILLSNTGFGEARNDFSEKIYEVFYGDRSVAGEQVAMDKGYI